MMGILVSSSLLLREILSFCGDFELATISSTSLSTISRFALFCECLPICALTVSCEGLSLCSIVCDLVVVSSCVVGIVVLVLFIVLTVSVAAYDLFISVEVLDSSFMGIGALDVKEIANFS